jgi:hypothetical protein
MTGGVALLIIFLIKIKEFNKSNTTKAGTTEERKRKDQLRLWSHDDIYGLSLSFALWIIKAKSFLDMIKQYDTDKSSLLKIHPFLSFQIDQHISTIISIPKGTPRILLIYVVALSGRTHVGDDTPICSQQFFAKGHLRNKWLIASSLYLMQSSQVYDSSVIFLLLKTALVFSLFCKSNKKRPYVLFDTMISIANQKLNALLVFP